MEFLQSSDWQLITFFVPIIIALAEIIKRLGFPNKFLSIIDLVLGIIAANFFAADQYDVAMRILIGIIIGLTAGGLYSGGKNTIEGIKASNGNGTAKVEITETESPAPAPEEPEKNYCLACGKPTGNISIPGSGKLYCAECHAEKPK